MDDRFHIEEISLINVAGHINTSVKPGNGVKVITWSNGTGKTKFLQVLSEVLLRDQSRINRKHILFREAKGSYRESHIRIKLTSPHSKNLILEATLSPEGKHTDRYNLTVNGKGYEDTPSHILEKFYALINENPRNLMLKIMLPHIYIENVRHILEDADKAFFIDRLQFLITSLSHFSLSSKQDRLLDELQLSGAIHLQPTENDFKEKISILHQTKLERRQFLEDEIKKQKILNDQMVSTITECNDFLSKYEDVFSEYQQTQTILSETTEAIQKIEDDIQNLKNNNEKQQIELEKLIPELAQKTEQLNKLQTILPQLDQNINDEAREYQRKLHLLQQYKTELAKIDSLLTEKQEIYGTKKQQLEDLTTQFGLPTQEFLRSVDIEELIARERYDTIQQRLNKHLMSLSKKTDAIRKSTECRLTETMVSLFESAHILIELKNSEDALECPLCQQADLLSNSHLLNIESQLARWTQQFRQYLDEIRKIEDNAEKLKKIQESELESIIKLLTDDLPHLDQEINALNEKKSTCLQEVEGLQNNVDIFPSESRKQLDEYYSLRMKQSSVTSSLSNLQLRKSRLEDNLNSNKTETLELLSTLNELLDKRKKLEITLYQLMHPELKKKYEVNMTKRKELSSQIFDLQIALRSHENEFLKLRNIIDLINELDQEFEIINRCKIAIEIFQKLLNETIEKKQQFLKQGLAPVMERLGVPLEEITYKDNEPYARILVGKDRTPALVSLSEMSSSEVIRLMSAFLWIQRPFERGLDNYFSDVERLDPESVRNLIELLKQLHCNNIALFTTPPLVI